MLAEHVAKGHCSKKAIEKILFRKQRWIDLQEDLVVIEGRLQDLNKWMFNLCADRKNIDYFCDMLVLQHQQVYFNFLNSLETTLNVYRENNNDEYFAKV